MHIHFTQINTATINLTCEDHCSSNADWSVVLTFTCHWVTLNCQSRKFLPDAVVAVAVVVVAAVVVVVVVAAVVVAGCCCCCQLINQTDHIRVVFRIVNCGNQDGVLNRNR